MPHVIIAPPTRAVDLQVGVKVRPLCVRSTLKFAISEAIRIGAPAYNRGDHAGCAFIYRRTAEELVARCEDRSVQASLTSALTEGARTSDTRGAASGMAWVLRRAFDALRNLPSDPIIAEMPVADDLWAERTTDVGDEAGSQAGQGEGEGEGEGEEDYSDDDDDDDDDDEEEEGDESDGSDESDGGRSSPNGPLSLGWALQSAINLGAPTFNAGDTYGCYHIYRRTAEEALSRLVIPAPSSRGQPTLPGTRRREAALRRVREIFNEGLAQARNVTDERDHSSSAWILRRCFDEILSNHARTASASLRSDGFASGPMPSAEALLAERTVAPSPAAFGGGPPVVFNFGTAPDRQVGQSRGRRHPPARTPPTSLDADQSAGTAAAVAPAPFSFTAPSASTTSPIPPLIPFTFSAPSSDAGSANATPVSPPVPFTFSAPSMGVTPGASTATPVSPPMPFTFSAPPSTSTDTTE